MAVKFSGGMGLMFLIISGILSGAFVSGNQMRANYFMETREDRKRRINWSFYLLLAGLPNVIGAVVIYILFM